MPRLSRSLVSLLLVPALLVTVSCSTDESALGPTAPAQQPQLLTSSLLESAGSTLLTAVELLACSEQPYAKTTKVIGPDGGTIVVGSHSLVIPSGALKNKVEITAEQIQGSANSVRFSPEGLRFARSAEVTLSYANCAQRSAKKQVVYTDEGLDVLEVLPSRDLTKSRTVTGKIDHFSRYAVAY